MLFQTNPHTCSTRILHTNALLLRTRYHLFDLFCYNPMYDAPYPVPKGI